MCGEIVDHGHDLFPDTYPESDDERGVVRELARFYELG
jgi:hypothetical protein